MNWRFGERQYKREQIFANMICWRQFETDAHAYVIEQCVLISTSTLLMLGVLLARSTYKYLKLPIIP